MITRAKKLGAFTGGAAAITAIIVAFSAASTATASPPENEDLRIQAVAQERAIGECMKERGFQYVVALPNDVLIEEAIAAAAAAGGDVDAAAEAAGSQLPPDPNQSAVAQLPEATQDSWYDNLHGTETVTACSDAYTRNSAREQERLAVDQVIGEAATATAESSADVRAAALAYVMCMSSRGYRVRDTDQITEVVSQATYAIISSRPWPSDVPEELPALPPASLLARWLAADKQASEAEAAAEDFADKANTAHEACVAPYDNAVDAAYLAALPS